MTGLEWIVEAHGCEPQSLAEMPKLSALFETMIAQIGLRPVGEAQWHQFPATRTAEGPFDSAQGRLCATLAGGITGLCLLAESHLAVHTFPEHASLCLNLFCCKPRADWDFAGYLKQHFGAQSVEVRKLERDYIATSALAASKVAR